MNDLTTTQYTNNAVVVSTTTPSISSTVYGNDVLICGYCSAHFSEIQLFIEHKQKCGSDSMTTSLHSQNCDGSSTQTLSTSPLILPSSTANSLMNLPVGMPHVILQSSGNAPQMYRLVLEQSPSVGQEQVVASLSNDPPIILDQFNIESPVEKVEVAKHEEILSSTTIEISDKSSTTTDAVIKQKVGETVMSKKQTRKLRLCTYEECSFSTPYKKDLLRHLRKHTGEKPFQCSECPTRFSRADKLNIHMRIHTDVRPFACTEVGCSYRARERACLKKHLRTHTNERPYKCQLCPYQAKDGSHLTVHLRSHTGDTPFHCQKEGCMAAFKTSTDLKRHEKMHTGERPFKCTYCDYASGLKSNLKVHVRINHCKDVKYSCQKCSFVTNTRRNLKEHGRQHTIEKISEDSKTVSKSPDENKSISPPPASSQGSKGQGTKWKKNSKNVCIKNYKCDFCGSGFVRLDSYNSHLRQHMKNKTTVKNSQKSTVLDISKSSEPSHSYHINFNVQGKPSILTTKAQPSCSIVTNCLPEKDCSSMNAITCLYIQDPQKVSEVTHEVTPTSTTCPSANYETYSNGHHSMIPNSHKVSDGIISEQWEFAGSSPIKIFNQ